MRKKLVVSGVNLTEGGPLTIFRECLAAAEEYLPVDWDIVAIVHDKSLFNSKRAMFLEFPNVKKSWLSRLKFEFMDCRKIASDINPFFWLSLHDVTPSIGDVPQATYFHNAAAFYRMSFNEVYFEPKLLLFSLFYRFVCAINIKRNKFLIVQQAVLREKLCSYYGLDNVVVAYPVGNESAKRFCRDSFNRYVYPALPRAFKNIELVLDAWKIFIEKSECGGELILTINGNENSYSRMLCDKYGDLMGVKFVGRLSPAEMESTYKSSDCLIFPSKLESWGLPLTEAKKYGLTILAADLPYAHETVGEYEGVSFFDINNCNILAEKMLLLSKGQLKFDTCAHSKPADPFAENWMQLLEKLF